MDAGEVRGFMVRDNFSTCIYIMAAEILSTYSHHRSLRRTTQKPTIKMAFKVRSYNLLKNYILLKFSFLNSSLQYLP